MPVDLLRGEYDPSCPQSDCIWLVSIHSHCLTRGASLLSIGLSALRAYALLGSSWPLPGTIFILGAMPFFIALVRLCLFAMPSIQPIQCQYGLTEESAFYVDIPIVGPTCSPAASISPQKILLYVVIIVSEAFMLTRLVAVCFSLKEESTLS